MLHKSGLDDVNQFWFVAVIGCFGCGDVNFGWSCLIGSSIGVDVHLDYVDVYKNGERKDEEWKMTLIELSR